MGHKYHIQTHEPVKQPDLVLPTPSPTPTTPTPAPSTPTSAQPQNSGNGMIWCSGPQAPGWNVNLPDGGCGTPGIPVHAIVPGNPGVVHLSDLPYTGTNTVDLLSSALLYAAVVLVAGYLIFRWYIQPYGNSLD